MNVLVRRRGGGNFHDSHQYTEIYEENSFYYTYHYEHVDDYEYYYDETLEKDIAHSSNHPD